MCVLAEINRRRLRPAMPNGALIDTVKVTSSVTDVYTVTLQPFDCGNQFPLFELTNGLVSGIVGLIKQFILRCAEWPSG